MPDGGRRIAASVTAGGGLASVGVRLQHLLASRSPDIPHCLTFLATIMRSRGPGPDEPSPACMDGGARGRAAPTCARFRRALLQTPPLCTLRAAGPVLLTPTSQRNDVADTTLTGDGSILSRRRRFHRAARASYTYGWGRFAVNPGDRSRYVSVRLMARWRAVVRCGHTTHREPLRTCMPRTTRRLLAKPPAPNPVRAACDLWATSRSAR